MKFVTWTLRQIADNEWDDPIVKFGSDFVNIAFYEDVEGDRGLAKCDPSIELDPSWDMVEVTEAEATEILTEIYVPYNPDADPEEHSLESWLALHKSNPFASA